MSALSAELACGVERLLGRLLKRGSLDEDEEEDNVVVAVPMVVVVPVIIVPALVECGRAEEL